MKTHSWTTAGKSLIFVLLCALCFQSNLLDFYFVNVMLFHLAYISSAGSIHIPRIWDFPGSIHLLSSLFPKRGNRNAKRTEKHKNKITQGLRHKINRLVEQTTKQQKVRLTPDHRLRTVSRVNHEGVGAGGGGRGRAGARLKHFYS